MLPTQLPDTSGFPPWAAAIVVVCGALFAVVLAIPKIAKTLRDAYAETSPKPEPKAATSEPAATPGPSVPVAAASSRSGPDQASLAALAMGEVLRLLLDTQGRLDTLISEHRRLSAELPAAHDALAVERADTARMRRQFAEVTRELQATRSQVATLRWRLDALARSATTDVDTPPMMPVPPLGPRA